ncbi:hypothetical protein [Bacillus thuringiensis]|uniref:hypothetical protein n=1 Tax=Bacillus thuringiensis TaxID=1428 RepID=UPI00211D9BC2|nr:hypothetical protein [Bacillus thuringiensis]
MESKVVTYYKQRKREHPTSPNGLEQAFNLIKNIPIVVCDITGFRLVNGMKAYFCASLDISTRQVLGFSLDTHIKLLNLQKDTIKQVKSVYGSQKKILSHSD